MELIYFGNLKKNDQEKLAEEYKYKGVYCSMSFLDIEPDGNIRICNCNAENFLSIGNIYDVKGFYIPNIRKCKDPMDFRCMSCFNNVVALSEEELLDYLKTNNINNEIKINNI